VQKSLNRIFIEFLAAFIELHVYLSPSRASGSPATPISPCCGTTGLGFSNKSSSSLRSRASPHSNCFDNAPRLLESFLLPPKELASVQFINYLLAFSSFVRSGRVPATKTSASTKLNEDGVELELELDCFTPAMAAKSYKVASTSASEGAA
jgi:hypothetical protein